MSKKAITPGGQDAGASSQELTVDVFLTVPPPLLIRPLAQSDRDLYLRLFGGMSGRSRYLRFCGHKTRLTDAELSFLVDVDHESHEALIAFVGVTGRAVGVARFVRRKNEPAAADVAIEVVDDFHGCGVGTSLLSSLIARAQEEGIERLAATTLCHNRPACRLLKRLGFGAVGDSDEMRYFERRLEPRLE